MTEFLTDDFKGVGAHESALQFVHAFLGIRVARTVGAGGPAERPLRGAAETDAPRGAPATSYREV